MDIITTGKNVFESEINALIKTKDSLNESFASVADKIKNCKGNIIFSAVGKPGYIASKAAATFSSLGIPAFFVHADEAMHGDMGKIRNTDIVIIISFSGESDEIKGIIPYIKNIGAEIICITANKNSYSAKNSDLVLLLPEITEACHMGLAPTSSTTAELCLCDALAVTVSRLKGFDKNNFSAFHPAGALGKRLKKENI